MAASARLRRKVLGCLGVLELERLWPARSGDVGTGRALVVVRNVLFDVPGRRMPLSLGQFWQRRH